jgi:antitoxin component YwqK of YwqJK toxin-antitoxin module
MKSLSFIILTSLFCITVYSQKHDYLPETREVILHQGDSAIKITVLVKNVDIDSENDITYYWLKRNRIHENKGGYTGNLLHGEYIIFNAGEKMICKGMFEFGRKTGEWKFWYDNGSIEHIEIWKDGLKDGDFLYYNHDGSLKFNREFQNDKEIVKSEKTTVDKKKFSLFKKNEKESTPDKETLKEEDDHKKSGMFKKKNKSGAEKQSEDKEK